MSLIHPYCEKKEGRKGMIAQVQKPMEEILEMLEGKEKLVLYGCGGCATIFHTGGEPEVKEMADTLSKHGKRHGTGSTCQIKREQGTVDSLMDR